MAQLGQSRSLLLRQQLFIFPRGHQQPTLQRPFFHSSFLQANPSKPYDPDPYLTSAFRAAANSASSRSGPSSGPNLGPFSMPRGGAGEAPLGWEEDRRWRESGWTERGRRFVRGARNGVVIAAGGTLGVLVIYSIVSELAAQTSPTNLMSSISTHLSTSPTLLSLLHPPLKFHSSSGHSLRRSRGPTQNLEIDPLTGKEVMRVRFWVEAGEAPATGERKRGWTDWQYYRELPGRYIGPLITSEPPPPPSPPPPTPEEIAAKKAKEQKDGQSWGGWVKGMLGSVMPNTMAKRKESGQEKGFFDRTPPLGRYQSGEITATLIKDPQGTWTYQTLFVDFPDAAHRHWRVDVLKEMKDEIQRKEMEGKQGWKRYRFWVRRAII